MAEYPPVSYFFELSFLDDQDLRADTQFQSIAGLSAEIQTETYREGGENRFEHVLPVRSKYNNLTLKRGLSKDSGLIKWCTDTFESLVIEPKNLNITLYNEEQSPLMTWKVVHAWPKKWSVSDLNAEQSQIAIETLELHYRFFTLIT